MPPKKQKASFKFNPLDKKLLFSQWLKMDDKNTSSACEELFQEYLKFMECRIKDPLCYPSSKIDKMWQCHILCTKAYARFSQDHGDGSFIHRDLSDDSSHDNYRRTLDLYSSLNLGNALVDYPNCWDAIENETNAVASESVKHHILLTEWLKMDSKNSISEYDELYAEYLKFVRCHIKDPLCCPSSKIDHLWHSHIICTKAYALFCQQNGGGSFIHHTPVSDVSSHDSYRRTLNLYSSLGFGDALIDHPNCWDAIDDEVPKRSRSDLAPPLQKKARRTESKSSESKSSESKSSESKSSESNNSESNNSESKSTESNSSESDDDSQAEYFESDRDYYGGYVGIVEDSPPNEEKKDATDLPNNPNEVEVVGEESLRYTETFRKLVLRKIASTTVPYSTKNEDGTFQFTRFAVRVAFGPGSNMNGVLFCKACNKIWEYHRGDDRKKCVFCHLTDIKVVIETCGCC